MKFPRLFVLSTIALALSSLAYPFEEENYPYTSISNGLIDTKIWIPDPENGYYRGTRFDWSGHIFSLRYKEHEYFGKWTNKNDEHNDPMGPAESFMANDKVLGYDDAKVGEGFIRIGVGLCEKPVENGYRVHHTYNILDHGKWTISQGPNWIQFIHELSDSRGYAYRYTKRLTLPPDEPKLLISHKLANTGNRSLNTEVFNHNFFVIDGRPSGPEFEIEFPFELTAVKDDLKNRIVIEDNRILYPQKMEPGMAGMIGTGLTGFSGNTKDNTFQITNKTTGAGVRSKMSQPLSKFHFWTIDTAICPEPYIQMEIPQGQFHEWTSEYLFFIYKK
ncbi:hypothetical protein MLD52_20740 [Puniceicoccaceae bacterium K14]|nr:hypothetical protein [Puniceicoccaceae bacterium K14]